jgi:hypothetical protein
MVRGEQGYCRCRVERWSPIGARLRGGLAAGRLYAERTCRPSPPACNSGTAGIRFLSHAAHWQRHVHAEIGGIPRPNNGYQSHNSGRSGPTIARLPHDTRKADTRQQSPGGLIFGLIRPRSSTFIRIQITATLQVAKPNGIWRTVIPTPENRKVGGSPLFLPAHFSQPIAGLFYARIVGGLDRMVVRCYLPIQHREDMRSLWGVFKIREQCTQILDRFRR